MPKVDQRLGVAAEDHDLVDRTAVGGADDADIAGGDAADPDETFRADLDVGTGDDHFADGFSHLWSPLSRFP